MDNRRNSIGRAEFFRRSSGMLAVAFFAPARLRLPSEHPDPRPGITSEHVLADDALGKANAHVIASYQAARDYPELFDGLSCACGCTGKKGMHRSLLSCFESMQPSGCHGCQDEAILVAKLGKQGKSLADIRTAVDKEFD